MTFENRVLVSRHDDKTVQSTGSICIDTAMSTRSRNSSARTLTLREVLTIGVGYGKQPANIPMTGRKTPRSDQANALLVEKAMKMIHEGDGFSLQWISPDLRDDPVVVLAAVKRNGMALRYASDELKSNKEIVRAAAFQNIDSLKYARGEAKVVAQEFNRNWPSVEDPLMDDKWWSDENEDYDASSLEAFRVAGFQDSPALLQDLNTIAERSGRDLVDLLTSVYKYLDHGTLPSNVTKNPEALITEICNIFWLAANYSGDDT